MSPQALYVYAVARPLDPAILTPLRGVDDAEVGVVGQGNLVAITSQVPLDRFDEEALRANLEQLDWLEQVARAHHLVVDAVARFTVTLPLRLATIYHDEERVAQVLQERHQAFTEGLDRVAGRIEWGVKVFADPDTLTTSEAAAPAAPSSSPGRDYLRRRQRQRHTRERSWERAAEAGREVDAVLTPLAEDVRRHRAQDAALSGQSGENVLNAAYLVPEGDSEAFAAQVRKLSGDQEGVRIELTGPWVPYSFAPAGEELATEQS